MSEEAKGGDSFAALFEQQSKRPTQRARSWHVGERVEARVVQVTPNAVFVDLDEKCQAWIDPAEIQGFGGALSVKVGDTLVAHVMEVDKRSGSVRLGRSLGKTGDVAAFELARDQGIAVEGKITAVNKGGAEVEVDGVRAFCPISQLDLRFVADTSSYVGRTLRFRVTEVRDGGRSVVLSRRALLEAEAREAHDRLLGALAPGMVVKGTVSGVREFGVFVDLGGIEGLVPASELSHDVQVKPADVVKPGDLLEVQVKEVRRQEGQEQVKITLSLKALAPDPWSALDVVAPVGRVVAGTVTRVVDFGVFVRLAAGVEGLLHRTELPGRVEHPSKMFAEGQPVLVVVKSVDAEARKIGLTLADEGAVVGAEVVRATLVPGAVVKGKVDRIEPFGVFVQIDGTKGRAGRGLIPNGDLGLQRGADVRKHFPEGTEVTAKVLEAGEGRLRLSIRALREDEERAAFDGYRQGARVAGMGTLGDRLKAKMKK
jgi:small subunit ribosomal protein S1